MLVLSTRTARRLFLAVLAVTLSVAAAPAAEEPRHPIAAEAASKLSDPAAPFVMVVTFDVKPGQSEAFLKVISEPRRMTAKEPGNVAYELSRVAQAGGDSAGGAKFYLYEHWVGVDALDEHLKQPYLVEFLSSVGGLLSGEPAVAVATPVPLPSPLEAE